MISISRNHITTTSYMKRILLALLFFAAAATGLQAQFAELKTVTFKGRITDSETNEPLVGASVQVKSKQIGTMSNENGDFEIAVTFQGKENVAMEITYLGYIAKTLTLGPDSPNNLTVSMGSTAVVGAEVVITGSRVAESVLESPVTIQKMGISEIQGAASGDFYQSIGNLAGVDITTSSMGFKVVNMRGFNTTSPVRSVQFIDGMDNQAPGLNFPVGNLVGANDLDLQSVELVSGAASALYGPNALQGVVSMTTKDPYLHQGLSLQLKGGTLDRNMYDGQFRYAHAFGEKQRLAVKVTGSIAKALDWYATDSVANVYGDISTTQNMSAIVQQQQYNQELSQEDRDKWIALNNYLDFNPVAYPGNVDITAPGYRELDLADYRTRSVKLGAGIHYKLKDSLELSYNYRLGTGTAVYQGTNRYSINNILFQQHRLELKGARGFVRAYTTQENAGESYDIVFTGINISKAGVANYVKEYLTQYFGTLDTLTNGFDDDAKPWMVDSAKAEAIRAAADAWYQPGSHEFDSLKSQITGDPDLEKGAKFVDRSSLQHLEGQYNFNLRPIDLIAGGNIRRYDPQSFGTIFRDTLLNPGDTLPNGQNDPDAQYADISQWEFGAYVQATKRLIDDRLKLSASFRLDKNQNFQPQVSPRISAVYSWRTHNWRIAAQRAFRSPTLQNQYILLDLGPIKLSGNLDGWDNLYTLSSVQDFQEHYDSTYEIDPSRLETITLDPLKQEQINSLEVGYRTILGQRLFIDLSGYYSIYSNFIGDVRVVQPLNGAQAGEESGENALLTNSSGNQTYQVWQIPTNASQKVSSYGGTISASFYFGKGITLLTNYTLAILDTTGLTDPIVPGFNTPKHKFNVGLTGRNVWKGLGFSANFKWVDRFHWQSSFGDGWVPSYTIMDAQVMYEVKEWKSTFRLGASNLLRDLHIEAYGSPTIGRIAYLSCTIDLKR
ncbi:MAG: carboxypeptidase-like regulatory domain-containing protein [Bacteroidia bacterium]